MEEMQQLQQMEQTLLSGRMDNIDPEELRQLMGQGAWQDFENLQQMQAMLEEAGFLIYKEGRVALSPKGVRRLGQLRSRTSTPIYCATALARIPPTIAVLPRSNSTKPDLIPTATPCISIWWAP